MEGLGRYLSLLYWNLLLPELILLLLLKVHWQHLLLSMDTLTVLSE